MNENWVLDKDFELSSDNESCYSDQIDSDIEAELYSFIHHDLSDTPVQSQNNSITPEENSVSSQNNSALSEKKSFPSQNNSSISQDSSVLPRKNSASSQNDCIPSKNNSGVGKNNRNCENPVKRNSANTLNTKSFFTDVIPNTNLYYSFETPPIRCATQVKTPLSENPKIHHTNKSVKRKSDIVSGVLRNIQVTFNTKSLSNHFDSHISNKKNTSFDDAISKPCDDSLVVVDETSDSDSSVIYTEPDDSEIKTNLKHDTVRLNSDSDDSDSSSERMLFKSCNAKSSVAPNLGPGTNLKDPWYIIADDLYRSKKHASRYHERATLTCTNCNLKGHNARFCSVPKAVKCFICGGDHLGYRCKHKVCFKCLRKGHDGRSCYRETVAKCCLCKMVGHNNKDCPDLWRRYHLTTTSGHIVKREPNILDTRIFCYNCGLAGHYGAVCKEPRMDRWCFPTWTSVICYKNPSNILQAQKGWNRTQEFVPNKKIFPFKKRKQHVNAAETTAMSTPRQKKNRKKNKPKNAPIVESKTTVSNNVYFPRTPKMPRNEKTSNENKNKPKSAPTADSKSKVSNDVYFPRTPKIPPNEKASRGAKLTRGCTRRQMQRWKAVENRFRAQQQRHQACLQRRLGMPFPAHDLRS